MNPVDILSESRILIGIDPGLSRYEVIGLLARTALGCRSLEAGDVVADLIARERKMTTGIGRGIAIPHTRCVNVRRPRAALGILHEGLDYGAVDDEPVHVIFTFVTPEADAALHIEILSKAVAIFASDDVRDRIVAAGTASAVMKILSGEQEKQRRRII